MIKILVHLAARMLNRNIGRAEHKTASHNLMLQTGPNCIATFSIRKFGTLGSIIQRFRDIGAKVHKILNQI